MRGISMALFLCGLVLFILMSGPESSQAQQGFNGTGRYRIEIVATGKALDLRMEDKKTVQQWTVSNAPNQQWDIVEAGAGYYFIVSVENGKSLDAESGKDRDGTPVIVADRNNSDSQRWKINGDKNGEFTIISKAEKSLDLSAGERADGARLQIWGPHGLENQRFRLIRIGEVEAKLRPREAAVPATVFAGAGRYEIQNVASKLSLDLKREDNRTLQQWSASGARNQQWDLEDAGDGFFFIRSVENGRVLEMGAARDRGAVVAKQQQTNDDNQKWQIVSLGNGQSLIVSKNRKAMEVPGSSVKEGQTLRVTNENRRDNQRFIFKKIETIERLTGGRNRPTRFPATQAPAEPAPYTPGKLNWRGRVDIEILLEVQGNTVTEKLVAGRSFNNGRPIFTAAMPARELSLRTENKKVRGSVEIVENPTAANGYKAVIRIRDPQSDAADYEFELIW